MTSRALALVAVFTVNAATPSTPAGVDKGWLQEVQKKIGLETYFVTRSHEASNPAHRFVASFEEAGVVVRPEGDRPARWEWRLSLVGWGRADELRALGVGSISSRENRVEIVRGAPSPMTEWYVNAPEGLEHGFTIPAAPDRADGDLVLDLALGGTLRPRFAADGQAIDFFDGGSVSVLRYAKLLVTDATGRKIPARFEAIPGGIRIAIDDARAVFPLHVDPLATSPAWTASGDEELAQLGFSVATAGDVNGDGYSDIVVGAPGHNAGVGQGRGRAYLYLGSAGGLATSPAWTGSGDEDNARFGDSVAAAGDVNGDGYADVLVGAQRHDAGFGLFARRGRAYLYLGSAGGLATSPAWTGTGEENDARFGASVATAGDVNGDGYSDILVGAHLHDVGADADSGRAYLYLGSAGGLVTTPSWTGSGDEGGARFGYSVATAGDVNGDGYADVVVGADFHDAGAGATRDRGRAYLYLGSAGGLATSPAWTGSGHEDWASFGQAVATAGDVNGDGYSDVLVGAPWDDGGGGIDVDRGRTYLYLGSAGGLTTSPAWTGSGDQDDARFGISVATAGDVNGDGYADVVVGATLAVAGANRGRAHLYLGSAAGLATSPTWTESGGVDFTYFGGSVATAGDVNGDGWSDVLVGAGTGTSAGSAYLYLGSAGGLTTSSSWTGSGDEDFVSFGASVATAGDVNGDGYSDFLVGAPNHPAAGAVRGRAYLYLGSAAGLATSPAWIGSGDEDFASFGTSLATAGDVNGDGYSDVLVGAFHHDAGAALGADRGRAYLYLGSAAGLATSPAWIGSGGENSANYGYAVAAAGDVNGDGYADVVVGAHLHDAGAGPNANRGQAYLYLGSAGGLATSPAWTGSGDLNGAQFGDSVGTAGDVDGDGYSDVLVGAFAYAGVGRAYLYLGGASGLATNPAWIVAGDESSAFFGTPVATAGDVNGDGYADVLVGAFRHDAGAGLGADRGRAYLYLGGAGGLATSAAWTGSGDENGAYFGLPVTTAGDVNGDGYADVLVGAYLHDAGAGSVADRGQAYLYLGSAGGLATSPAWTGSGDENGAFYGLPVAPAGDVNGDGYADVLVGVSDHSGGGNNRGRAYLYLGNAEAGVSGGVDRIPGQVTTVTDDLIALLGKSDSELQFRLRARGRTPAGRGNVRLQWEVKPLGTPFDGTGLGTSPAQDTGAPGPSGSASYHDETIGGLAEGTFYHWRSRTIRVDPFFPRSPWMSLAGNNVTETKFRTSGCIDRDGDGYGGLGDPSCLSAIADCNDQNPAIWGTPGETGNLLFTSKSKLAWDFPPSPGGLGSALVYDTLRSESATGFQVAGECVESNDGSNTTATDLASPLPGKVWFYLTRAENACPQGTGSLGSNSLGVPRAGRSCP